MKVIMVEKIENIALNETLGATIGTTTITISDTVYHTFNTILGVYVSAEAARKAVENEKMELIKEYGVKALDDENIEDKHTFYTFASRVLELKEGDNDDGRLSGTS